MPTREELEKAIEYYRAIGSWAMVELLRELAGDL